METCKICGEEFKNLKALTTHVKAKHGLLGKEYYDKYMKKESEGECVVCGKETTYRNYGGGLAVARGACLGYYLPSQPPHRWLATGSSLLRGSGL